MCLNILREDWKPVLTINSIVYGLQYLFLEPNPDDPLNKEAATELQANREEFSLYVIQLHFKKQVPDLIDLRRPLEGGFFGDLISAILLLVRRLRTSGCFRED